MNDFPRRLARVKNRAKLWNAILARWFGVPPITLQRWLDGENFPSQARQSEILELLSYLETHASKIGETAFTMDMSRRAGLVQSLKDDFLTQHRRLSNKDIT
jgi:hypothetical protein